MLTLVEENPMITINGLTKRFGNVTALDDISVFLKKDNFFSVHVFYSAVCHFVEHLVERTCESFHSIGMLDFVNIYSCQFCLSILICQICIIYCLYIDN